MLLLASCQKDDFLSQQESNLLFAESTTTEINNILTDWQKRNVTPTYYTILQESEILSGRVKLKIVSFQVNNLKEYGALLIPYSNQKIPVRMMVSGFDFNNSTTAINLLSDNTISGNPYILAIPALRGQSLKITINGTVYYSPLSEGNLCDAFNEATDDVIAFLNGIQQTEISADVNRTSVRGGSRGGTVALLAGIRDQRVKRVVDVVGPTNLLELASQNENDPTYQCQFLSAFKNGQATIGQTRKKMIAASPIYFAQHLPLVQLHMGLKDVIVPVKQGYDLEKRIANLGKVTTFELFNYDKAHADIATNNTGLEERIKEFLLPL